MKNLSFLLLLTIMSFGMIACGSDNSTKTVVAEKEAPPVEKPPVELVKDTPIDPPAPEEKEATDTAPPKAESEKEPVKKVNDKPIPKKEKVEKPSTTKPAPVEVSEPTVTPPPNNNPAKPAEVEKPVTPPTPPTAPVKEKKEEKKEEPPFVPGKPDHGVWNQLLGKHVSSSGKVNYKGFKKDISSLKAYLKILAENPIQSNWSRSEKMAYWINAYNAFTVKLIVDNYPISSITKLDGGKPWDKKWIKLGDKTYSLNQIENDILRPQYKDARIHFAVNCAAKSCPPLLNKAWTAKNLESNFERQAKAFINNAQFNKVSAKKIEISKIFEWYAVDFGDIVQYINKYSTIQAKGNAKVSYLEYDWSLNE